MEDFKIQSQRHGNKIEIVLTGPLNERSQFENIKYLKDPVISVDLSGINSMNSTGIRNWLRWVQTLEAHSQIILKGCPRSFVDQSNMLQRLYPEHSIIESFYVPYYNEDTGSEKMVLYRRGIEFKGTQINHPTQVTDEKGEPLSLDAPARYFDFLKHQKA